MGSDLGNVGGVTLLFVLICLTGLTSGVYSGTGHCVDSQWSCSGTSCIPMKQRCDGTTECVDGSDEHGCASPHQCPASQYVCLKTNGATQCLPSSSECSGPTGCGAKPVIPYATVNLKDNNSAYGATAEVICDDGYESCGSSIKCLESGNWEMIQCTPKGKPVGECEAELGECTKFWYENTRLVALISSGCKFYCHCEYASSSPVTYKWAKKMCGPGTLFDMSLPSPVCNHARLVNCKA